MKITFTERMMQNGVLIITAWDGDQWCSVVGLKPGDQTANNIKTIKKRMADKAQLPGSPRNGSRVAVKC